MARYPFEEFTKVVWVPGAAGVADLDAPTLAEIAAGTDITCFITKDGLNPGGDTATVGGGSICTRVVGQSVGSVKYDFTLKMFRDNGAGGDDAWDLAVWGTEGTIVVRRGVLYGTAFAAGQKVEVYHGTMGEPIPSGSSADTEQDFNLKIAVASAELKATVAA